jgi:hypothetical protein
MTPIKKTLDHLITKMSAATHNVTTNLKYVSLLGALLIGQELKGQVNPDWPHIYPLPEGKIYLFASEEDNEESRAYDAQTTQGRNNIITTKIGEDLTNTIRASEGFTCNQITFLTLMNFRDFGEKEIYLWDAPLYNNYNGTNIDSIYTYGGTWANIGKHSLPMLDLTLYDSIKLKEGHGRILIYSGNNLLQESMNIIEPQTDQTQMQPGQDSTDIRIMPNDLDRFEVVYHYLYETPDHRKNLAGVTVAKYTIKNGKIILLATNPDMDIITERDTINPIVTMTLGEDNNIHYNIDDKNFKKGYYTINDIQTEIKTATGTIDPTKLG